MTLVISIVGGTITGFIIKNFMKSQTHYGDDKQDWELPTEEEDKKQK